MSRPALEARLELRLRRPGEVFDVAAELELERGVLVLFGPSGAGKSLTIQALAGLIRPDAGWIRTGGETLYDAERRWFMPAHARRVGYVPQHDSLFPFRDVAGNVAFGLPRGQRRRDNPRVEALMQELGISHLAAADPASLSGGERQRVTLARALAVEPRLLLLDEPFGAIDREGRSALHRVLRQALENHGIPAVVVTHDPDEALALGDRLVRFERGRTVASGTPAEILGRAGGVLVSGELAEPPAASNGRVSARLRDVTVEAPTDLLHEGPEGRVTVRLPGPPEDPAP